MRSRKLVLLFSACAAAALTAARPAEPLARVDAHEGEALAARPVLPATTVQMSVSTAAGAPAVGLEAVDGGVGYYGRFSSPLPTSADYFPIGVWGSYNHTRANRDLDAAVGINTYVWAADSSFMPAIRSDGRFWILQAEWENRSAVGSETAGWVVGDELDMQQSNATGAAAARNQLNSILAGLPNDGRARYSNYGKGVIFWNSTSDSEQYVNDFQQIVSSDIYWFADNDSCTQWQGGNLFLDAARALTTAECKRASNYGATVDRMRALDAMDGERQPIWNFVEVGHPFTNSAWPTITAPQIRAAVWHSIIAGARGILYFQHNFGGPCLSHQALRDACGAEVRPTVTAVNAQIRTLAPVLNAPTVTSGVTAGPSIRAMVKWSGGHFFVFAGSRENVGSVGTVSIPCIGNATAVRLGEGGEVAVSSGSFSDTFQDGNAIHIYRIDGGTTCGLPPGASLDPQPRGQQGPRGAARVGRVPRHVSLRSGRLRIPITCSAACTVRSRLTMPRASRRILIAAATRRFTAGRHKLVLRLSRRDRRRVAAGRAMRLRTVIVQTTGRAQRTQRLLPRRH